MKLGLAWLLPAARGQRMRVLGHSALETGQIFVLVSLMLLAAIEANITLALVQQQAPAVRAPPLVYSEVAPRGPAQVERAKRATWEGVHTGRAVEAAADLEGMRCPRARPTSSGSRSKRSGASAIARCALP